jgi:glyoxylase-like metal-dependent hydrolase (beta-lactamase superfamily II)
MTLDGTNTWIVGDPSESAPIVIDPGPRDDQHLEAILVACGGAVGQIILTHRHADHAEGAPRLAELAKCGVRAADPVHQLGTDGLHDQDVMAVAGLRLEALATPGHTSDSFCLLLLGPDSSPPGEHGPRLLTGDTVLGRGTSVITHPDGNLGSYLTSLERIQALVRSRHVIEILPGHGPRVQEPERWLAFYSRHRQERLEQVRLALAAGDRTPAEVVARVYADVDRAVWPAAEQSVAAQLEYLAAENPT